MPQNQLGSFGKYELIEKIAAGGMAEVYRARSRGLAGFEKILVIKKILPHLAKDKEFVNLFIDEARIAVQLLHVNIVQVFDLGEIDGQYFMAMEYVQGLDLSRLLARANKIGRFPIPISLFIMAEVLKALQFAHDRVDDSNKKLNIVHCDISPQNILISHAGEVKLTDFGISRAAFQLEEQHQVIRGKYAYMSPEQVEGGNLDGRTDLFSLTIVLFEMLTGRRLFKSRDRNETLLRVRRAEVPSPRGYRAEISSELESFLFKGLSRLTKDRFASARDMLEALSSLMASEGHRATNNDLAAFLKSVVIDDNPNRSGAKVKKSLAPAGVLPPSSIVVLSVEAFNPPRAMASPKISFEELSRVWSDIVTEHGGDIWEKGNASMLCVWVVKTNLKELVRRVIVAARKLRKYAKDIGYQPSVGLSPGVARLSTDSRRPSEGWELAGPFYLARWMMNFSAHRGRILITEVAAKQLDNKAVSLGRIAINNNRYITLYEI